MSEKKRESFLPREPIDEIIDPLSRFLHIESAGGIVLLLATIVALVIANTGFGPAFHEFWMTKCGFHVGDFRVTLSLEHWINDGLMTIFFFVVGLEVKRELVVGELRSFRRAALPIAAALGGMVAPALIYLALQHGGSAADGWGIPMATDIAFVVGCLALLGSRVPPGLRVFLLSLAIADDIGAIVVIAVGYTDHLNLAALGFALLGIGAFYGLMKAGVRNMAVAVIFMFLIWFGVLESGIHATVAGVIFGLFTPVRPWIDDRRLNRIVDRASCVMQGGGWKRQTQRYHDLHEMQVAARKAISPLERFENKLHPWQSFLIMPLFALANAGVPVSPADLADPVALAVVCGLFFGKPLGIVLVSWFAVRLGLADLPEGVGWGAVTGGGFLAGIGFTMALFIAGLALKSPVLDPAKVGILAGSLLSAVVGMLLLLKFLPKRRP